MDTFDEMTATGANHDAIVIGAGFAGLYAVHKLRDELGLRVRGFEAAGGPGGTWWWNRYPGARCDFESVSYAYSFSADLQREWEWTERFASQPEILRYLEWASDRLDVRREFRFDTRVTSVVWDEGAKLWTIETDKGDSVTARYVVTGVGNLSRAKDPEFLGLEDFAGELLRTSSWPHQPVDLTGKRVGVIGTGATGIQVIPEVAKQAAHLTVFQRTPNYAAPLGNEPVAPDQRRWLAENHEEVRAGTRRNFIGLPYPPPRPSALLDPPEERRKVYDQFYDGGGFRLVVSTYGDLLVSKEANDTIAEYLRDRVRERVDDPATAELLCPTDHPYASKRAPFESGYYETFNRENVALVDVASAPIERITARGVKTSEAEYELDVLILAIGFDALTGPLLDLGVVGRDGRTLQEKWGDEPETYLGIGVRGFPNFFTVTGPRSAIAAYNNPLAIEDHVEFIAGAIRHARDTGAVTVEPAEEAERRWGQLVEGVFARTLFGEAKSSWFTGTNVLGKPKAAFFFAGGVPLYRALCDQVIAHDLGGFELDGVAAAPPPLVGLDPGLALSLAQLLAAPPLEDCTPTELQQLFAGYRFQQAPAPDIRHIETTYPGGDGGPLPVRIYRPDAEGPLPIVVFFHAGGWMAGSLDVADTPCRALAASLDAIVVSASYRLAPEHPFPAATDDTFAALCWTAAAIAKHGGDPARIAVMGESTGANLAAVAALRARDEGGPEIAAQVLVYPLIAPHAETQSQRDYADMPLMTAAAVQRMWRAYLGGEAAASSPLAAPARATSLADLPPALVLTAELDPTRDEAEQYAAALAEAGVAVDVRRVDGMVHGALNVTALCPQAGAFLDAATDFLSAQLHRTGAAAPTA
jgi:cation diffusion facilitator CzcD-associated flavoprotein CzcO/acetyl esterase/lipase